MGKIAIYPGSFDPITNGHLDVIRRSAKIFEKLYVVILENPTKKCLFSVEERLEMLYALTSKFSNIIVDSSDLLTVTYAKNVGAEVIVRGLRATMDFEYELQIATANQHLDENIETFFLVTKKECSFITSSIVKEIAAHGHSVYGLVDEFVERKLKEKF